MNKLTLLPVCIILMLTVSGCSQNPYFASQAGAPWGVPQTGTLAQGGSVQTNDARLAELSRRVQLLDDNNRQLHTQLAQSEQKSQVYRDETDLLRRQLAEMSQQAQSAAIASREAENRVRGIQASTQIGGGATIRPNTNLSQLASRLNLGGLPVQPDGNTIRIRLPSDQLFQPGTGQLLPQAATLLDPVAAQLKTVFPRNRIGIEGHTDNGPIFGGNASSSHQLTAIQSAAVLDMFTRRAGFPPNQLFTVAQGANRPLQNNGTPAGRAGNRRIELVVHPEGQ